MVFSAISAPTASRQQLRSVFWDHRQKPDTYDTDRNSDKILWKTRFPRRLPRHLTRFSLCVCPASSHCVCLFAYGLSSPRSHRESGSAQCTRVGRLFPAHKVKMMVSNIGEANLSASAAVKQPGNYSYGKSI